MNYQKAIFNICNFQSEDVITTSNNTTLTPVPPVSPTPLAPPPTTDQTEDEGEL